MFDSKSPRIFAEPCGVEFPAAVIAGIRQRLGPKAPPEAMARVTVIVGTARMRKRLLQLFLQTPGFVPRIHLATDLSALVPGLAAPPATAPLRLQLELAQLTRGLLLARPGLAPPSSAFALAGTLQALLAEMEEEGVPFDALRRIDPANLADHWQQSLTFLKIIERYLAPNEAPPLTAEARGERLFQQLRAAWAMAPPQDPVILAGSTGSRRPLRQLMQAVLDLPQGGIVLPGFDFDLPAPVWDRLLSAGENGAPPMEDHPQARAAKICADNGLHPAQVAPWSGTRPFAPARNALVSLALRPAPVTDVWRSEGAALAATLSEATDRITLLEAQSPREEANAIALRLRAALERGQTAALVTTDRLLTRQVAAALDRWNIEPDDSAGTSLGVTASGRLMRLIANARGRDVSAETLLILLKHPQVARGDQRGRHLLRTRLLEHRMIRGKAPFPTPADLDRWAAALDSGDGGGPAWCAWVARVIAQLAQPVALQDAGGHLGAHLSLLSLLLRGPEGAPEDTFWDGPEGTQAREMVATLSEAAPASGEMSAADYAALITDLCAAHEVRDPFRPHPQIMIWGTREARVNTADLVILGGLNDTIWPATPPADPWLSRAMRQEAGLRLPEQSVGLSAHDWQQAVANPEIWLSRAVRDAEAETVPSRWLGRLLNLVAGLPPDGPAALKAMTDRGAPWLRMARTLDRPDGPPKPAPRPAPAPPVAARPKRLSVTQIERLIRDPYAIYAAKVLGLEPLAPLRMAPDARIRGTVIHEALGAFGLATRAGLPPDADTVFTETLDQELHRLVPWPAMRRLWRARLLRLAPWFLETEAARRCLGTPAVIEEKGTLDLGTPPITLSAKADRIDLQEDGSVAIFDYKTGKPPTDDVQAAFDRQLPLEALIVEAGGFASLGVRAVGRLGYISFSGDGMEQAVAVSPEILAQQMADLRRLLVAYETPAQGYTARRAPNIYDGDFDHLARFGEWDDTTEITKIEVGR